jgi:arylsulfatase A-like enzyme
LEIKNDMKNLVHYVGCSVMSSLLFTGCVKESPLPNVIFILADDLGWPQTSAYGSTYYLTPNIDRLSREGIRFTDAYAACGVCSPTRASIMTGKYPARLHLTNYIPGSDPADKPLREPEWQKYLPLEEYTLGELFRDRGYRTAFFGKWHLSAEKFGPESFPFNPDKQGFDDFFIIDKPTSDHDPDGDPSSSDSIGNKTVRFIRENADHPFFIVSSFSAIHHPLMENRDSIRRWENMEGNEEPPNNPVIAAMLYRMDRNIGKVIDVIDELDLREKTFLVFYSDNGGVVINRIYYYYGSRAERNVTQDPLREGKAWLYEGGIRVPLVISWPGTVKQGGVTDAMVSSIDFFPTFCELLGVKPGPETDGISFLSHLTSGASIPDRQLYWHYPHYHIPTGMKPAGAIRKGRYKLIEWYEKALTSDEEGAFELFDVKNDIGEAVNLADSLPEMVQILSGELANWREIVDAQMPVPNPDYGRKGTVENE